MASVQGSLVCWYFLYNAASSLSLPFHLSELRGGHGCISCSVWVDGLCCELRARGISADFQVSQPLILVNEWWLIQAKKDISFKDFLRCVQWVFYGFRTLNNNKKFDWSDSNWIRPVFQNGRQSAATAWPRLPCAASAWPAWVHDSW